MAFLFQQWHAPIQTSSPSAIHFPCKHFYKLTVFPVFQKNIFSANIFTNRPFSLFSKKRNLSFGNKKIQSCNIRKTPTQQFQLIHTFSRKNMPKRPKDVGGLFKGIFWTYFLKVFFRGYFLVVFFGWIMLKDV